MMTRIPPIKSLLCLLSLTAAGHLAAAVEIASDLGPPSEPLSLWYRSPASEWTQALPIGNGRLGAMVFGSVDAEKLQLNEDTFWSGQPYTPANPNALAALPQARSLVFGGRFADADTLINSSMLGTPPGQAKYQPSGDVHLDFPVSGTVTGYRRDLNLDTAVASVTYQFNGVTYLREVFSSPVDNVMVMRISANQPGAIHFTASFSTPQTQGVGITSAGGDTLVLSGTGGGTGPSGVAGSLPWQSRLRVINQGGSVTVSGNTLVVSNTDSAVLLIDAATAYKRYNDTSGNPATITSGHIAAASLKSYAELHSSHIAEHQRLFRRVGFDLGRTAATAPPTDERLHNFKAGANDPHLPVLYFQFGRYLLISCSRPGTQPANLQGLWNDKIAPMWDSKYTINTQMNYWPAETANLSELTEPLIRMVKELSETGAQIARTHYDADGWVTHHNTDLWRAAAPIDGAFWGMWPLGGAWLCTHLWEHYLFTLDKAYLAEVYPVLKGASRFFLDTLVADPADPNRLVTCPSISPENAHPYGSSVCAGPTMDMSILRDLFAQTAQAAEVLGLDEALRNELTAARAKLVPFRIGAQGQLQEWKDDWDGAAPEQQHRHISHLYGLFPSAQIDMRKTPDLAAAAANSLNARGDMSTGWAIAWRINCWARLREGDRTYDIIKALLDPSRTYDNLFDAHPPFQIDGNFGGVSGMIEMLLQSHSGEIDLLPALPSAWPAGSITGLRARGGFEVGLIWAGGELTNATIRSVGGTTCRIRYGSQTKTLTLENGGSVVFVPEASDDGQAIRSTGGNPSASSEDAASASGADKAFDRMKSTGWHTGDLSSSAWLQYEFPAAGPWWAITRYKLVGSSGDEASDPSDWQLLGSDDESDWTILDTRSNEQFTERGQEKRYTFANTRPFRFYRLNVTATAGGAGGVRIAEFQLWSRASADDASASVENPPNESAEKAFDGAGGTKWFNSNSAADGWLQFRYGGGSAWVLSQYTVRSGNDAPGRDPRDWQFQGSNDGINWITLDTRTGETFPSRLFARTYSFGNNTAHRFHRIFITANAGGPSQGLQLSELILGTPGVITTPPGGMTAATGPVAGSISLDWLPPAGAATYQIRRAEHSSGPFVGIADGVTGTEFVDFTAQPGVRYHYVVAGANASGTGPASDAVPFLLTAVPPTAPENPRAVAGPAGIILSWNPSALATRYIVKRSSISGGSHSVIGTATSTAYTDLSAPGGTCFYTVSATNSAGESADSVEASATLGELTAWLKFDEAGGNTATDSSGSGKSATLQGDAMRSAGKVGSSIWLTGSGYLSLPQGAVSGINDFTVAAWVRPGSVTTWMRIFDFGSGTGAYMFLTPKNHEGVVCYAISNSGWSGEQYVKGSLPLPSGVWTHVAVTQSGNLATLYVNGQAAGTNPALNLQPAALGNTTQNWIGRSQYGGTGFSGNIDDFRIYRRTLSAAEVSPLAISAPAAPGAPSVSPGNGELTLSWNGVTDATSYSISRSTSAGGPLETISSGITATGYLDAGLAPGTSYYYTVRGVNLAGEGEDSPQAMGSTFTPGEAWRWHWFDDPANSGDAGDSADPDGDGIRNLLERAFGGDPTAPDLSCLPTIDGSEERLSIIYRRSRSATDLDFSVRETHDMEQWKDAVGTGEVIGGDTELENIRFTRPAGQDDRLFLRLDVRPR